MLVGQIAIPDVLISYNFIFLVIPISNPVFDLINLIYYSSLNEFYLDNTPCIQITDKIQVYTNDNGLGNNYILKAKNEFRYN